MVSVNVKHHVYFSSAVLLYWSLCHFWGSCHFWGYAVERGGGKKSPKKYWNKHWVLSVPPAFHIEDELWTVSVTDNIGGVSAAQDEKKVSAMLAGVKSWREKEQKYDTLWLGVRGHLLCGGGGEGR